MTASCCRKPEETEQKLPPQAAAELARGAAANTGFTHAETWHDGDK